ncbi:MAG: sigma-70 family RNA polymerase sigma factor [Bacteroidia bacterium]|nr:sigma-70 family RNA polymerase sigma factor [Bacteroidia bacterium]
MEPTYANIHKELIDKCRKGDYKAQFEIYKLYYKAMYNTSLRIVNDKLEAEDIMQESFLSAFEKLSTYRGDVSFGAWLKRIVINQSLDFFKKKKVVLNPIDGYDFIAEQDTDKEPEEIMQIKAEQIKQAINSLPERYKLILTLYLLEGYDHDEIAEILKITNSTSRAQLTRAKQKLVELIKNKNGEKIEYLYN